MRKKRKGFTLIEVLVVLAILGLLVMIGVPKYKGYVKEAELTRLKVECSELGEASMKYYMSKGDWPRLSEEPYSKEEVLAYGKRIVDETGETISLEEDGKYYDLDYEKMGNYISKPEKGYNYVLQNPVGRVYGIEGVTRKRKEEYVGKVEKPGVLPVASIGMRPEDGIVTGEEITWLSGINEGEVLEEEWEGKQSSYEEEGTYIVRLRVKNEKGLWSEWVEKEIAVNVDKPIANIRLSPAGGLTTQTDILWTSSSSLVYGGKTIVKEEWEGKQSKYSTAGMYTVKLRVQDSEGVWSEWVEKRIEVKVYNALAYYIPEQELTIRASSTYPSVSEPRELMYHPEDYSINWFAGEASGFIELDFDNPRVLESITIYTRCGQYITATFYDAYNTLIYSAIYSVGTGNISDTGYTNYAKAFYITTLTPIKRVKLSGNNSNGGYNYFNLHGIKIA